MEFTVDLFVFQKALKLFGAVAKASSEETDGQLFIDVRDTGDVILLCNNKNLSLTHVIPNCAVKLSGVVAILYGKLNSFLSAFSYLSEGVGTKDIKIKALKNELSVTVTGLTVTSKTTTHKLKLKLFPPQKIALPSPFTETIFELNCATLRLALSKVLYAINPASVRPFLQGVSLIFTEEYIYFAGTDGQKLSEYTTPNTSKFLKGKYTVSFTFFNTLKRIIDSDHTVYFSIIDGKIKAKFLNTVLHGSLVLGEEYPDYQKAFNNFTDSIVIDKQIFLSCLAPVLPTLDPEDHNRLTLHLQNNKLILSNDFAEAEYSDELAFEKDFVIDLNGNYLVNTINSIMDDLIRIQFSNDTSVLIFDAAQFNNQKALITPIRRH